MVVRFKPEIASFTSVPGIDTSAQRAASDLFGQTAKIFNQINAQANEIADTRAELAGIRSGREAVNKGVADGKTGQEVFEDVADQDDLTIFGRAQFQAAQTAFAINTKAEVDSVIAGLAQQNANDPENFIAQSRAAIQGFVKEMPEDVAASIEELANRTITANATKISANVSKQDFENAQSLHANSINRDKQILITAAANNDTATFDIKAAELNAKIDAAVENGLLTEAGAALKKQEVLDEVNTEAAVYAAAQEDTVAGMGRVLSESGMNTPEMQARAITLRAQRESQIEANLARKQKQKTKLIDTTALQFTTVAMNADQADLAELKRNMITALAEQGASPSQISKATNEFDNIQNFATADMQDSLIADANQIIFEAPEDMQDQLTPLLAKIKDPQTRQELQEASAKRREYLSQATFVKNRLQLELDKVAPIIESTTGVIDGTVSAANRKNQEIRLQAESMLVEAIQGGQVPRERIPSFIVNEIIPAVTGGDTNAALRRSLSGIEDIDLRNQLSGAMSASMTVPIRVVVDGKSETSTLEFPKLTSETANDYLNVLNRQINSLGDSDFERIRRQKLIEKRKAIKDLFIGK